MLYLPPSLPPKKKKESKVKKKFAGENGSRLLKILMVCLFFCPWPTIRGSFNELMIGFQNNGDQVIQLLHNLALIIQVPLLVTIQTLGSRL